MSWIFRAKKKKSPDCHLLFQKCQSRRMIRMLIWVFYKRYSYFASKSRLKLTVQAYEESFPERYWQKLCLSEYFCGNFICLVNYRFWFAYIWSDVFYCSFVLRAWYRWMFFKLAIRSLRDLEVSQVDLWQILLCKLVSSTSTLSI